MQAIVGYKNELELLIEEQTTSLSVGSKRLTSVEEALRHSQADFDKKDAEIRRLTESFQETKKKLMQAEVKIRQLT